MEVTLGVLVDALHFIFWVHTPTDVHRLVFHSLNDESLIGVQPIQL